MGVEDEASRYAMEAADVIREEGTEVMPTATPNPPEIGGVEAMRTGKGKSSQSVGTMARQATGKEKWRKLDAKAEKYILVGYSDD